MTGAAHSSDLAESGAVLSETDRSTTSSAHDTCSASGRLLEDSAASAKLLTLGTLASVGSCCWGREKRGSGPTPLLILAASPFSVNCLRNSSSSFSTRREPRAIRCEDMLSGLM